MEQTTVEKTEGDPDIKTEAEPDKSRPPQVANRRFRRGRRRWVWFFVAILLAGGAFFFFQRQGRGQATTAKPASSPSALPVTTATA